MKNLISFSLISLCLASSAFAQNAERGLVYSIHAAPICECSAGSSSDKVQVTGTSMKQVSNADAVWRLLDEAKAACKVETLTKANPKSKYKACGLKFVRVLP